MSDSTKKPVGPEIAFFVRTSTEVHFRTGPIKKANQEGLNSNLVSMSAFDDVNSVYSPCGKFVAVALKACMRVLDTQQEHKEVCVVNRPNIVELHWSPKSTFLVTYERKVSREDPSTRFRTTTRDPPKCYGRAIVQVFKEGHLQRDDEYVEHHTQTGHGVPRQPEAGVGQNDQSHYLPNT
jgi:uncharacterized protein with WD repeat